MRDFLLVVLALAWLLGTWLRLYRQARFFQIEEYLSRRYLAWVWRNPKELLPRQPLMAWFVGSVFVMLSEAPDGVMPHAAAVFAALVASWPPRESEIKKPLVRTGRLKRILVIAAAVSTVVLLIALYLYDATLETRIAAFEIGTISALGMVLLLLAPLWLTLGNLLLQPYEAQLRRLYLRQARNVLALIQPKIVGITGSYGKTTTKVYLSELLNLRYRTYATPKSYNTLMGISLAINRDLADDFRTEYFISEMGAYVPRRDRTNLPADATGHRHRD